MYKTTIILFSLIATALLGACGKTETKPVKQTREYTQVEKNKMTYCVGLADTANIVAIKKKANTPKQELLDYYAQRNNAKMTMATVEKVYKEDFTSVYSYTVDFFKECAMKLADITQQRVGFASYCMQNQLIADYAHRAHKSGKTMQQVQDQFAVFKNETVNRMVEFGYTTELSRAKLKLLIWNTCMEKITAT